MRSGNKYLTCWCVHKTLDHLVRYNTVHDSAVDVRLDMQSQAVERIKIIGVRVLQHENFRDTSPGEVLECVSSFALGSPLRSGAKLASFARVSLQAGIGVHFLRSV